MADSHATVGLTIMKFDEFNLAAHWKSTFLIKGCVDFDKYSTHQILYVMFCLYNNILYTVHSDNIQTLYLFSVSVMQPYAKIIFFSYQSKRCNITKFAKIFNTKYFLTSLALHLYIWITNGFRISSDLEKCNSKFLWRHESTHSKN